MGGAQLSHLNLLNNMHLFLLLKWCDMVLPSWVPAFPRPGSWHYLKLFSAPSLLVLVVITSHWHHTLTWVSGGNSLVGSLPFSLPSLIKSKLFPSSSSLLLRVKVLILSLGLSISLEVAEVEYLFVIPKSQQYLLKALLSNWRPLSEIGVWGTPNRVTIFFQIKFLASTSLMLARGSASTHLVK